MPLKIIIGLVLIAHGIGHGLGYAPIFGWAKAEGWSGDSWMLTGALGPTVSNVIALVLWTIPLVGFVLVGLGVFGVGIPADWIRPMAVVSSVVSIVGVVLFWDALPALTSKIGAIAIDVIVLWAVIVAHWPSSEVVPG
jgi:hypothetical protein